MRALSEPMCITLDTFASKVVSGALRKGETVTRASGYVEVE